MSRYLAPSLVGMSHYLAASLLSAALLAAATRPWGAAALAWPALLPAFLAVAALAVRGRYLAAGLCGSLAALGFTSVAYEATLGLSLIAYLVIAPVAALPYGLATSAAAWTIRRLGRRVAWLALPAFWCGAEVVARQEWLLGRWTLPVSAIGYTQAEAAAVHLARFSSVTAVSFAVLLTSGLLLELVSGRGPASRVAASGGLALVALVVWLAWRSAPPAVALGHGDALTTVAVVQPNLPTSVRAAAQLEPLVAAELLERLLQLTSAPEAQAADLVVWPEAAWPGWAHRTGAEVLPPAHLSLGSQPPFIGQPPLLLGAASIDTATGATSNAALAWTGTRLTHVFDKRHPVPLAEDGLARSHAPVVALLGGLRVSPLICYDVAFPATVREAARGGAELLAVLTDDTFAAGSDVPLQHLRVALLRAVETGLWLAFASNGGPSALIDPAGRIAALSQAGEQAVISATTRLGTGSTPYLRFGDWAGALACLLCVGLACFAGLEGGAYRRPRPT